MNGCRNLATNIAKDLSPNAKRMGQLSGRYRMFSISICMVWDSNNLLSSSGRQQQQQPLRPSTAVPTFGTPLPTGPQTPHRSPASVQPISTPAPTPSEPSKGPTRRTLEEIDAEEEELDREEERIRARRRQLREERRQLCQR